MKIIKLKYFAAFVATVAMIVTFGTNVLAAGPVAYDNIPSPQPGNVPSVGYEATSTSEFGSQIDLDTAKQDPTVTVLMSSWGCQGGKWHTNDCVTSSAAAFTHPVTLNIYNVNPDNSVGSLIVSDTKTFTMPYRPSADSVNCTGSNAGKWFDGSVCFNGKAFPISFDLSGTTLPDKVIIGVAYNTTHYGVSPIGTAPCSGAPEGCPYDSLNVGTNPTPSVGASLPSNDDAYLDSSVGGFYCDGGAGGTGTFRLDAGCWTGFLPAIRVEAEALSFAVPEACSDMGTFGSPIVGTSGDDVLTGTGGSDLIFALSGNDQINAYGGNDCIVAGAGNDTVNGSGGNDVVLSGNDNDTVIADSGADTVYGERGDDELNGGSSNDSLYGGDGDDTLIGGAGNDSLDGGENTDSANGSSGIDACTAETEISCET